MIMTAFALVQPKEPNDQGPVLSRNRHVPHAGEAMEHNQ